MFSGLLVGADPELMLRCGGPASRASPPFPITLQATEHLAEKPRARSPNPHEPICVCLENLLLLPGSKDRSPRWLDGPAI